MSHVVTVNRANEKPIGQLSIDGRAEEIPTCFNSKYTKECSFCYLKLETANK